MELLLAGVAMLLLAVAVWQSVRRPMTGSELRRRIKALDNRYTDQDAARPSRGWRRGGERRKSQPVIGRRTLVRVSGFAGLAVTLSVGLVWVDRRYSAPSSGLEPVRAPARTINDARSTVDPGASRPRPARLDLAAVGLGTVLAPEVLVASAASAPRLSVVRSGVGADVVNRKLVGQSDTFAVSTRAAFWTHVTGGRPGDRVRHVWFHEDNKVGFVDLAIGSPSWRTHSRRPVVPGAEGNWAVEVWDVEGRVLARHEFRCESGATS